MPANDLKARQAYQRRKKYGVTPEHMMMFEEIFGDACHICFKPMSRIEVDHCHSTGRIRGLLCINCNTGLGKFKDDIATLQRAIDYLSTCGLAVEPEPFSPREIDHRKTVGKAVLTPEHVRRIRTDKRSNEAVAATYGVSAAAIQKIRDGRSWKWL